MRSRWLLPLLLALAACRHDASAARREEPPAGQAWMTEKQLQEAKVEVNGEEIDASRTTTTEIKDIGTTKVNVPSEAKKKLS